MRFCIGITDYDWFRFLAARPELSHGDGIGCESWELAASRV